MNARPHLSGPALPPVSLVLLLALAMMSGCAKQGAGTFHTILTGNSVQLDKLEIRQSADHPELPLILDEQGRKIFADYTATHLEQHIAITLDGKVLACPMIKAPVREGILPIVGDFSTEDLQKIAGQIRNDPKRLHVLAVGQTHVRPGEMVPGAK